MPYTIKVWEIFDQKDGAEVLRIVKRLAGKNAEQRQLRKVIYNLFTDQMRQDLGKVHGSSPLPQ